MNTIFKVAKAEWRNLFYSPVAWLVMLFFSIVCGWAFSIPLQDYWRMQLISFEINPQWNGYNGTGLTKALMDIPAQKLVSYLFLFIPLLTMGVINRDITSGTIKLLYSSPIRVRDIVLGKYLGLLSFVLLLLVFIASIFAVIPTLIIESDPMQYISTILGLLLLAMAYISIGVFISSLTTYQIVSGVLTFIVFFTFNSIGNLWQQYDFIRDLTYFLNISGRMDNLLLGLITSRDVCYFLLITVLFIGFTLVKLKSTQESKSWMVSFRRYMLVFSIVLFTGYITSIPGKILYWDTTAKKVNTLHPNVQSVIKEMDGSPLTVTLYTNLLGINAEIGFPQNRNKYIWQVWDKYRRFYPNMVLKYEYYYDVRDNDKFLYQSNPGMDLQDIRDKFAKRYGVKSSLFKGPEEIRKIVDFKNEELRLIMKLDYKGKSCWLRTFEDAFKWHLDTEFSGAIKRLTRTTPRIYYTTGNYERSILKPGKREYLAHTTMASSRTALINHGVDCDTISLSTRDIPGDNTILVIADPQSKLPFIEEERVNSYINRGGTLMILGEPGKIDCLNPILNSIGVELEQGILVNTNQDEMPSIFNADITDAGAFMSGEHAFLNYRRYKRKLVSTKIAGATSVSYNEMHGFKTEPVMQLKGDNDKWLEKGHLVVDSAAPIFSASEGDMRKDKYNVVVKMERTIDNINQRIVVAGDADLLSDKRMAAQKLSYYSWLFNNEYPTYTNPTIPADLYFKSKPTIIKIISWAYTYIIPILVLLTGTILLVRRKRK